MALLDKLGEVGSKWVGDAVKLRGSNGLGSQLGGGLTSAERARLREDIEKVEALLDADETEFRLLVLGPESCSLSGLMTELVGEVGDDFSMRERLGRGRWYQHEFERGGIHLLDARSSADAPLRALEYHPATAIVLMLPAGFPEVGPFVDEMLDAIRWNKVIWGFEPEVMVAVDRDPEGRDVAAFRTQQAFKQEMVERGRSRDAIDVVHLKREGRLVSKLLSRLPPSQRYSLARLSTDRETRREAADSIVRLCASVNASIATISLPMASSVPITSIQILMIAGIAYVSGRDFSLRTIAEFLTAIGLNVGAGYAFRELARALVGFVPVAGSLISASIAGGATITLGKAAQRYFIDE